MARKQLGVLPTSSSDTAITATTVPTYATVAALRAATTPPPSGVARIVGYSSANDGGGGLFRWDASDTTSVHNGGTILTPTSALSSSGRWKRIYDGNKVNVRWFGCLPSNSDNTAALQAAVDWVCDDTTRNPSGGLLGGVVFIPMGYYRFMFDQGASGLSTITVDNSYVTIQGEGYSTQLTVRNHAFPSQLDYFFTFRGAGNTKGIGGGVRDLGFAGNAMLKWCIYLDSWHGANFENIYVSDVHMGVLDAVSNISMGEGIRVIKIDYSSSSGTNSCLTRYGVRFRGTDTASWSDSYIKDCIFVGIWDAGVVLDLTCRFYVDNIGVSWNYSSANTIDGSTKSGVFHAVHITHTINSASWSSTNGMHSIRNIYHESHQGVETTTDNVAVLIDAPAEGGGWNRFNRVENVNTSWNSVPAPSLFRLVNDHTAGRVSHNYFSGNQRPLGVYGGDQIGIGAGVQDTYLDLIPYQGGSTAGAVTDAGTRTFITWAGITSPGIVDDDADYTTWQIDPNATTSAPSKRATIEAILGWSVGVDAYINDLVGGLTQDDIEDGTTYKQYSDTEKTKLAGIEAGATNYTDSDADARIAAAVGTSVQAYDADLTTWAGKTAPSGTVVGTTDTQTLSGKRIDKRVGTTSASTATYAIDTDTYDAYFITAQAVNITNITTTGTPQPGQQLLIGVTGTATRTISWSASHFSSSSTVTIPTQCNGTARTDFRFVWDAVTSRWRYDDEVNVAIYATLTNTQTFTNKTLTNPRINAIYDTNGAVGLSVAANSGAVNWIQAANSAAGGDTGLLAAGTDTDVNLSVRAKGAGRFTIQDGTDTSKRIRFNTSNISTSSTRVISFPDATTTLVGLDTAQTLTNKTLTAPVINSPTGITAADIDDGSASGIEVFTGSAAEGRTALGAAEAVHVASLGLSYATTITADGVTDVSTALGVLVSGLPSGSVLQLGPGDYYVPGLRSVSINGDITIRGVPGKTRLLGDGSLASNLYGPTGAASDVMFELSPGASLHITNVIVEDAGVLIGLESLTNVGDIDIRQCAFINSGGIAMMLDASNTFLANMDDPDARDFGAFRLIDNNIVGCELGVLLAALGGWGSFIAHGNVFDDVGMSAIWLGSEGVVSGSDARDPHVYQPLQSGVHIYGNTIRRIRRTLYASSTADEAVNGIAVWGQGVLIHDNYIEDVDLTTKWDDCEGIYVKARYFSIHNNTLINAGGSEASITVKGGCWDASTTLDASMNGLTLPQATIAVASTTGFPGTVNEGGEMRALIETSAGWQVITWTGKTATTLTGVTGGTGTLATGGVVRGSVHLGGYLEGQSHPGVVRDNTIVFTNTDRAYNAIHGAAPRILVEGNYIRGCTGRVFGALVGYRGGSFVGNRIEDFHGDNAINAFADDWSYRNNTFINLDGAYTNPVSIRVFWINPGTGESISGVDIRGNRIINPLTDAGALSAASAKLRAINITGTGTVTRLTVAQNVGRNLVSGIVVSSGPTVSYLDDLDNDWRNDAGTAPVEVYGTASNILYRAISGQATLTGTETLTNKTLTQPRVDYLRDTNGAIVTQLVPTTSAVNYLSIRNAAATGGPSLGAVGTDTNIPITFIPKGTGTVRIFVGSGATPTVEATGADTNHDLNLISKGAGLVKANGVEVATLTNTQTLTNKTIALGSNTVSGTLAQFNTAVTDADLASLAGTETLTNKTLTNPTITNYTESVVAIGNTGTTQTISLTSGTVQTATATGNCVWTMPTATAGKSFMLFVNTGAGSFTQTFTGVKWAGGTAPTFTTTASRLDIFTFVADGTNWYGSYTQNYTP